MDPTDPTPAAPPPPLLVTVVGTVGSTPIPTGTIATTPDHQPNLIVRAVSPLLAVLIRFLNAYLTSLVGLVTIGLTTNALPAADFAHLVLRCASLALAGSAVGFGKDIITVLGNLEKKYPLLTGSV